MSVMAPIRGDYHSELEIGPLHQFQRELNTSSRRWFKCDDSFGETPQRADPMFLVFHGLTKHNFHFAAHKPLKFPWPGQFPLHTRGADFEGVPAARNDIFDVQNGAHILRDALAIGVGYAFRFVYENAYHTAAAPAQYLDVNDFQTRVGAYALGNLPHSLYDGRPVRHVSFPTANIWDTSNKKVGFRPLRLLVPET